MSKKYLGFDLNTKKDSGYKLIKPHPIFSRLRNSTWAFEGAVTGSLIGVALGLILSILIMMRFVSIPGIAYMARAGSFLSFGFAPVVCSLFGAVAGVLVGVGTPKGNQNRQNPMTNLKQGVQMILPKNIEVKK